MDIENEYFRIEKVFMHTSICQHDEFCTQS